MRSIFKNSILKRDPIPFIVENIIRVDGVRDLPASDSRAVDEDAKWVGQRGRRDPEKNGHAPAILHKYLPHSEQPSGAMYTNPYVRMGENHDG